MNMESAKSNASISTVALELLNLEDSYRRAGQLTSEEHARWVDCAKRLFSDQNARSGRRSTRLPVAARCLLRIEEGLLEMADVTEISRDGFTLFAEIFRHIRPQSVEVLSLELPDGEVKVALSCNVICIDDTKAPPRVALEIARRTGAAAWTQYFDGIYYPTYINFLKAHTRPLTN
jgi:hypothetical protein